MPCNLILHYGRSRLEGGEGGMKGGGRKGEKKAGKERDGRRKGERRGGVQKVSSNSLHTGSP